MAHLKRSEALTLVQQLVDQPLQYALKSLDFDLYDLGFGSPVEFSGYGGATQKACTYAVHVSCGIKIMKKGGDIIEFYGDSIPSVFYDTISQLIGHQVRRIAISEKNDLWLDFGEYRLVAVTFEDGDESWRFFMPGKGGPHLVASDAWLRIDTD